MSLAQYFNPPDKLHYESVQELPKAWEKWKRSFDIFMEASECDKKDDKIKVSIMLNLIGPKGQELYDSFSWNNADDKKVLNTVIEKFQEHVKLHKSVTVSRYDFFSYSQKENQSLEDYIKELTIKRNDCNFDNDNNINDSLLRDRIIGGINDRPLQEKLLRIDDSKATLKNIVTACRVHEASIEQSGMMEGKDNQNKNSVMKIGTQQQCQVAHSSSTAHGMMAAQSKSYGNRQQKSWQQGQNQNRQQKNLQQTHVSNCSFCGSNHIRGRCPAYGKNCSWCTKPNHFESVCNAKRRQNTPVNRIHENSGDQSEECVDNIHTVSSVKDDFFICTVNHGKSYDKWKTQLRIENDLIMDIKVDCGADVSIMNYQTYCQLSKPPQLSKCNVKYKAYNNTNIPVHGKCMIQVESHNRKYHVLEFVVADYESVLSGDHSVTLGLLKKLFKVEQVYDGVKINPSIFNEIGCLEGEVKLHLKEGAIPVVHAPRRVPVKLYNPLKVALDKMEAHEVIHKVTDPTDWVSSLVITEKPGTDSLRICLDPKDLNMNIKRQHYPMRTTEEVLDKLQGATFFTKLDASSGYWQIKVDEESSKLLCFNTPFGRYAFKRLPFGIHASSEIFQKKIEVLLEGLEGVANIQDDIIVWGTTKEEHDHHLQLVIDRLYESGLRLNLDKCLFGVNDLIYTGHRITKYGIMPDPKKISAIEKLEMPKDIAGVQRILGMITYVGKFVPKLSEITKPLRDLLDKNAEFKITQEHEDALKKIKQILTSNPILKVFDPKKPILISADASKFGMGAVLLQQHEDQWLPISYASRSLTKTEARYAQIEKECLAIVFACTRFHHYTYGQNFTCESDHKPLENLFKKNISEVPARIQRMMLYLQKYPDMKVKYMPGTSLKIADALSRNPEELQSSPEIKELEAQVHMIQQSHPISDEKMNTFRRATANDPILMKLSDMINSGWPNEYKNIPKELNEYWQYRDILTSEDGIIYKGEQIVVPGELRTLVKSKIHEGHLGIGKCVLRAKTYFFWPHMVQSIEDVVKRCEICQENRNAQQRQPNIPRVVTAPWHTVGSDIFHFGIYHYLIITDYYSGFPEVLLLNKGAGHGTSEVTIEKMKSVFARHGIPQVVISDGGPQFTSEKFDNFAREWEFKHELSDPYYPRGNGKVERSVETVKKLIRKAHSEKTDVYGAILAYRTTPFPDCNKSPTELLMNRSVRTRLNSHVKQPDGNIKRSVYNQKYANRHTRELSPLRANDHVRVRSDNHWPIKAKVVGNYKTNPRSYIVETLDGQKYRRNRQHLLHTREQWSGNIGRQGHLDDDYNTDGEEDQHNIHEEHSDNVIGICDGNDEDNTNNVGQTSELVSSGRTNVRPVIELTKFNMNDFNCNLNRSSTRSTRGKIDRFQS